MYRHTVVRELPVPTGEAYAWLTDYREDDISILGDPRGSRRVERLAPGHIRLDSKGEMGGVRGRSLTDVWLTPPDRWWYEGDVKVYGVRMAHVKGEYSLSPRAPEGCRLNVEFTVTPLNFAARLYLRSRREKVWEGIERTYDRIAAALAADRR